MGKTAERFFKEAIRANFGCEGTFLNAEPVVETFEGKTAWEGIVHVFALRGHPTSSRCYVWSSGDNEATTILHDGPINSPQRAVQASLLAMAEQGPQH